MGIENQRAPEGAEPRAESPVESVSAPSDLFLFALFFETMSQPFALTGLILPNSPAWLQIQVVLPLSGDGVVGTYHCALRFSPRHFYLERSCKGFFIHSALSQMLGMCVSYRSPMARCGLGRGPLTQQDFSNIPVRCFPWPRNRSEQPIREPMAWCRSVRREPEAFKLQRCHIVSDKFQYAHGLLVMFI